MGYVFVTSVHTDRSMFNQQGHGVNGFFPMAWHGCESHTDWKPTSAYLYSIVVLCPYWWWLVLEKLWVSSC